MRTRTRYALLRHVGAPDDPLGLHFDLLLEDGDSCRTWRLQAFPAADRQIAAPLPPHRLIWLERRTAEVSGGRGWAERVAGGLYRGQLPDDPKATVAVTLLDGELQGQLEIDMLGCRLWRG